MADEEVPATKRVVKKTVVRKTVVVRPPPSTTPKPAPTRTRRDWAGAVRTGTGRAGAAAGRAGSFTGGRLRATANRARALRLPHLRPVPAAAAVGVLVGIVLVGAAAVATAVFSNVRGVASGGSVYGTIALVVIAVLALVLARYLLAAFAVTQPGMTAFLAGMLTLVATLAFLGPATTSGWAWLVVPALVCGAMVVSHVLLTAADPDRG